MSQLETLVFSRTLKQVDWPNATVCKADLAEEILVEYRPTGKDIPRA